MNTVLDKINEVKTKVDDLLTEINKTLAENAIAEPSAQDKIGKLEAVKGKIDIAKQRVNEIKTGAKFRDLQATGPGTAQEAKEALGTVNTTAESEISNTISYGGKSITAKDIQTPINEAKKI